MPLHLLSKKSWNVYNTGNVERVRRDEAAARKREEEEEMKMQAEDAERRLLELRRRALGGDQSMEAPIAVKDTTSVRGFTMGEEGGEEEEDDGLRRRCKPSKEGRAGYNDNTSALVIDPLVHKSLTDKSGHINLFSQPRKKLSQQDRNPEYEKEKAEKEAKAAEQYSMSLGKPAEELKPWYVTVDRVGEKQERKSEKTLGWERKRDEKIKDRNDPMAMIRQGVRQVKEIEVARKQALEEQRKEIENLDRDFRELEEFTLDGANETHSYRERGQGDSHNENSRKRKKRSSSASGRRRSRSRDGRTRTDSDRHHRHDSTKRNRPRDRTRQISPSEDGHGKRRYRSRDRSDCHRHNGSEVDGRVSSRHHNKDSSRRHDDEGGTRGSRKSYD